MLDSSSSAVRREPAPDELQDVAGPSRVAANGPVTYRGPERRSPAGPVQRWLAMLIDEIDYGMVLLTEDAGVAHVNHMARLTLEADHPLILQDGQLHARSANDANALRDAITAAAQRSRRCLLRLGAGAEAAMVSVVPLDRESQRQPAIALILGKRKVCEPLSVESFARAYRLTTAETKVLTALCNGARVREVAVVHGVETSTVRSQISSIRAKTGAESIAALVRQVAVLPPLLGVLRGL